ncbi:PKD domain-containing protein [Methanospirillum hungatei]|nr:PKD domain-containing protein [Methanospirillum hungatei]
MNQANMTLVVSDNFSQDNLAYGDFLYLFDTTTASAGDSVNTRHWNITVTEPTAYSGSRDSYIPNPVFGPFLNETSIIVNLTLTNATSVSYNGTDVYQVIDGRKWIRPSYSVTADFRNKTATNPIGTIRFNDTSEELLFPMAEITDWWWKVTDNSGVPQNTSGWDNFTVNMTDTDYYQVNLTVRNSQGNLASLSGYTGAPEDGNGLIANFAAVPVAGTAPLNVSFIDLSSGEITSWDWDFDFLGIDSTNLHSSYNQNPTHTYKKPGIYSVNLTIYEGSNSKSCLAGDMITVYPPPVYLAVAPTKGEKPLNVTVISRSYGLNASPIYEWDFGNGMVVNTTTPSYVYTYNPGGVNPSQSWNYTIRHTVYSDGVAYPAQNTQNVTIETPAPPRARFAAVPQSGPAPLKVSFVDQSEGKEPFDYIWNFDDGKPNVYDVQNPTVTFETPKVYNVTLYFNASNGADQAYVLVNVTEPVPPVIDFAVAPTKGYNPLNVTVISQCSGLNESPVFEWDFGNGTKRTTTDLSYVYQYKPYSPNPNMVWEYPINLTVYSDGLIYYASKSRNVTVENAPTPKAAFNAYPRIGSRPLEVSFFDQSIGQEPINYEWYFGDNTPKVFEQNPVHVYNETGEFNVTLMIHAKNGNDIINQTGLIRVTDYPIPNVSFSMAPVSGYAPLKVSFIDQTCKQDCSYEYFWQFGEGNTSTKRNPVWEYVTPGNYSVNLTVTDKYGVSGKGNGLVNVTVMQPSGGDDGQLVANFTALSTRGVAPFEAHFIDQSSGNPKGWRWDFSDKNVSFDQSPNHTFFKPGIYNVTLEVYNKTSYSSNITKLDYITAISPIIDAWFSFRYIGDQSTRLVQFFDGSKGVGINSWEWTFGDGTTSTEINPVHLYSSKGIYNVKLLVSNGYAKDIFEYVVYI